MNEYQWPCVTVLLCTYDRPFELGATFGSLTKNLQYPRLSWHLADDGSPSESLKAAIDHVSGYARYQGDGFSYSVTQRKGWGANVNHAAKILQDAHPENSEIVFFTEDDHVLQRPLDLRPYVAALLLYEQVGMVRFGIAGHDGVRARLRELDISPVMPEYMEALGSGSTSPGKLNAWEVFLGYQEERGPYGFWRYSNRPHLKHRRFHNAYGPYVEGQTLAQTEQAMNHTIEATYKDMDGKSPAIIVPCEWTGWCFDHIGHSRQGTPEDVHNG